MWAETLWDLRPAVGREAALALITGGMRLTVDNPSMIDARDAILQQALAMRSAPGAPDDYFAEMWEVFRSAGWASTRPLTGPLDGPDENFNLLTSLAPRPSPTRTRSATTTA